METSRYFTKKCTCMCPVKHFFVKIGKFVYFYEFESDSLIAVTIICIALDEQYEKFLILQHSVKRSIPSCYLNPTGWKVK